VDAVNSENRHLDAGLSPHSALRPTAEAACIWAWSAFEALAEDMLSMNVSDPLLFLHNDATGSRQKARTIAFWNFLRLSNANAHSVINRRAAARKNPAAACRTSLHAALRPFSRAAFIVTHGDTGGRAKGTCRVRSMGTRSGDNAGAIGRPREPAGTLACDAHTFV